MKNEEVENILLQYPKGRQEYLLPILQDIQNKVGYIPINTLSIISNYIRIPGSTIYGVASFYNQFRFVPRGKYHFQICYGTACYLYGSSTLLEELEKLLGTSDGQVSDDGLFSLEMVSCLGGCAQAPVISINGEYYSKINLDNLQQIVTKIKIEENIQK